MTTENKTNEALTVGNRVIVEKGSRDLGISKGVSARVTAVRELGAEYSYQVEVTLFFLNGFKSGRTMTLTAHHPNRLKDAHVRLRNIMQKNIEVKRSEKV